MFFFLSLLLFDIFLTFLMFIVKCPWALERRYINKTYYYIIIITTFDFNNALVNSEGNINWNICRNALELFIIVSLC